MFATAARAARVRRSLGVARITTGSRVAQAAVGQYLGVSLCLGAEDFGCLGRAISSRRTCSGLAPGMVSTPQLSGTTAPEKR